MSRSLLHDWECSIERCCRDNLYSEMLDIAKDIYNTAYERGKNNRESIPYIMHRAKIDCSKTKCENCTNHNYCDYELNSRQESEGKE